MNDSQAILDKIAALRRTAPQDDAGRVLQLERQVHAGSRENALLDGSLRQLADPAIPPCESPLPVHLTARARRLLEHGRELLVRLRAIGLHLARLHPHGGEAAPPLLFHETVTMADTALRLVQAFPDAPSGQLQLCAGLEAILGVVADRVANLQAFIDLRQRQQRQLATLAELLLGLAADRSVDVKPLMHLAEEFLADAEQDAPLRFHDARLCPCPHAREGEAGRVARFVACHALNVAQVTARLSRHDPELRHRPLDLVLAALLHDAGMLRIPESVLAQPAPLGDTERRLVEGHSHAGADMVRGLFPNAGWLGEALCNHHERLDGTGYPAGLRDLQLAPLVRLLAVCDVYAALCAPRPYRCARDTRDALADTLLLAEQGTLDRAQAERLLELSFYPVGTLVELTDGAVGVVVATHMARRTPSTPASPVVALLTDTQRQPLPAVRHLDLGACLGCSITRSLSPAERRDLLGNHHPELAA